MTWQVFIVRLATLIISVGCGWFFHKRFFGGGDR